MDFVIIILVIILFFLFISESRYLYRPTGRTRGVCTEVRTEIVQRNKSPRNRQLRGIDARRYIPYVKYQIDGVEYIAKSEAAFSQAKIFPGDEVEILINDINRQSVKIVKRL